MGIPLSDVTRRPGHRPVVTIGIIVACTIVFLLELAGGNAFVERWSMIPANVVAGRQYVTVFTAMFMHASWMHIIGNMVFFWAFGPEIEDAMGPARYLGFYLLAGIAATAAQVAVAPSSTVPNLGASGAIAGVMGAFIITYPRDRIRTLLFLGFFVTVTVLPAALLIGLWFLLQLVSGIGSVASVQTGGGGVAYMAHVGGFVFGMVAARVFERRDRLRMEYGD